MIPPAAFLNVEQVLKELGILRTYISVFLSGQVSQCLPLKRVFVVG